MAHLLRSRAVLAALLASACARVSETPATPELAEAPPPAKLEVMPLTDADRPRTGGTVVGDDEDERPPEPESDPCALETDDDANLATLDYNNLSLSVRVVELEPEHDDEDEDPVQLVRIGICNRDTGTAQTIERPTDFDACLVESVEPSIDVIDSDSETLVFDARHRCVVGATVTRVSIQHVLVAAMFHEQGVGLLYEGSSWIRDNRGLEVTVDKREFYVEAGDLAVYEHSVQWCDKDGLEQVMGMRINCANKPRKLELLERVPVGVSPP